MWLLLMILLFPQPSRIITLKTYPTEALCHAARNYVGFEMAEAYPHERDFYIICLKQNEPLP